MLPSENLREVLSKRLGYEDPGIVHQQINASKIPHRGRNHSLRRLRQADVAIHQLQIAGGL